MDRLFGAKPAVSETLTESWWRRGLWFGGHVGGYRSVEPLLRGGEIR